MRPELLYRQLVPTLGPRIVPALEIRLRAVCKQDDRVLLADRITQAIADIDGDEIPLAALRLLSDSEPRLQRLGARILRRRPIASALDPLWHVHVVQTSDPDPFLWRGEHRLSVYEDTFNALRACVRLDPVWLERSIRSAKSVGPMQDLAYLVASVGDAALWARVKAELKARVPAQKARALALCMELFKDAEEGPWLRERIGEEEDLQGASALKALVRLDPEQALKGLDALSEDELYMTRLWHVRRLLLQHPARTREHLLQKFKQSAEPWNFALVLQGSENAIDRRLLTVLLDAFVRELTETIDDRGTHGRSFHHEIAFLLRLTDPDLLDELRERRSSDFEHQLLMWLRQEGPQEGSWRQHVKFEAFQVLARVGGEGLTDAVNEWLLGDQFARLDAMRMAPRRFNDKTIALLDKIASDEREGEQQYQAGLAVVALAACGKWAEVVRHIVRLGLSTQTAVSEYRSEWAPLEDDVLASAMSALDGADTAPGAILAIGVSGRRDLTEIVRQAAAAAPLSSPEALACTYALRWLEDSSSDSVPALVRMLGGPHDRDAANALLVNGTPEALKALAERVHSVYDHDIASALWIRGWQRHVIEDLTSRRLLIAHEALRLSILRDLVADARTRPLVRAVLQHVKIQESIRNLAVSEESVQRIGADRAEAIKVLAVVDPVGAYALAASCLKTGGGRREKYVYLLAEIDRKRAIEDLLDRAAREADVRVLWAIGRVMDVAGTTGRIQDLLQSDDRAVRGAGCLLLERISANDWAHSALDQLAKSEYVHTVNEAASTAMEAIDRAQRVRRILERLKTESDPVHRWTLLDALIDIADPGDEHGPTPAWVEHVHDLSTVAMRQHMYRRLRDREKEEARKADKRRLNW